MTHARRTRLGVVAAGALLLGTVGGALLPAGCGLGEQHDAGPSCYSEGPPARVEGTWIVSGKGERSGCADPTLNHDFELGPATLHVVMDDPNQYDASVQEDASVLPPAGSDGGIGDAGPDGGVGDAGRDGGVGDAGRDGGVGDAGPEAGAADDGGTLTDGGTPPDGVDGGAAPGQDDGGTPTDAGVRSDAAPDAAADAAQSDAGQHDAAPPIVYQPATLRLRDPLDTFDLQGTVRGECVSFDTTETIQDVGTVTYSFTGAYESFGRRVEGSFTSQGPGNCTAHGTFTVELQ